MRLRHICFGIALAILAALLTGCGGSGGGTAGQTTRVLAGFVYAKGNALGSGPDVVITSSANPPSGYFAPTSGTVTLNVADGTLTRAPGQTSFDLSVSNALVVTAVAAPSSNVNVSGANIMLNGAAKSLTSYAVGLGVIALTGTVELITSPSAPSYTPGTPVALKYTINGNAPAAPKELFVAGAAANTGFGPRTLACVGLDSNGVINPAATFTLAGSAAVGIVTGGATPSFTMAPDTAANSAVEGDSTFTVQLVGQNVTGNFVANFSYGTVGAVAVSPSASSLLWKTAGAPATITVGVTVTNTLGGAMFGKTVTLTDPGRTAANVWIAGQGNAFAATSGVTDTTGSISTTLAAPTSVAAVAPDVTPKGSNTLTATCLTVSGTGIVKVIRPMKTVTITGPTKVYVGTTTPATDPNNGAYAISSTAIDVDNLSVPIADYPAASFTYTCANVAGGATFGNTGDTGVTTTSVSALVNANSNQVVAGATAGKYTMTVTGGVLVPSNSITTDVYGGPTKIFLSPNTNTTNPIAGASGNYTGVHGTITNPSFTFLDSANHPVPGGEVSFTSQFTIDGATNGNITTGGLNVGNFTLTFGNNPGLIHMSITNGTWSPAIGGSFAFNVSKNVGHDGS